MNFIKILEEDRDNIMEKGRQEGIKKGRQEGIEEGKRKGKQEGLKEGERLKSKKIAQKLLKLGIDIKDIKKATELSEQEIKKLECKN